MLMDGKQIERVSQVLAAWQTRRKMLKGLAGAIVGGAIAGGKSFAQGDPSSETPPVDPYSETPVDSFVDAPAEQVLPTDTPTDIPFPTDTPWATDTPTPTEEATATEIPPEPEQEVPTDEPPVVRSAEDPRPMIAELCRQAASVLDEDVSDPSAFDRHPHPSQAYGFLNALNGVAIQGMNAETWDDKQLASYVTAADAIAFAVRIGADAYYEAAGVVIPNEDPKDPDTCIFRELAKWAEDMSQCDPDDALCRMTAFWDFTVLKSCRRCLRAF
jgi:hypothetical protein